MKNRILISSFLAATLVVFGIGAAAQLSQAQSQSQQDQTNQGQSRPGMMGGGMMGMMGQMTTHHQQMSTLMNKLIESMAAIQNEKDPAALKSKLAEQRALLDQMHSQMMQQGNMMQMMSGQIGQNCSTVGETAKPPAK